MLKAAWKGTGQWVGAGARGPVKGAVPGDGAVRGGRGAGNAA
jgi:hypothetical protein